MNQLIVNKLAKKFAEILKRDLSAEEFKEVIRLNKTKGYIDCCASHNYLDANMSMDEAFTIVMGREYIFFNDEKPETERLNENDTDLINSAWDIAKNNDFNL